MFPNLVKGYLESLGCAGPDSTVPRPWLIVGVPDTTLLGGACGDADDDVPAEATLIDVDIALTELHFVHLLIWLPFKNVCYISNDK